MSQSDMRQGVRASGRQTTNFILKEIEDTLPNRNVQ
jgi:hypothetical protein